MIQHTIYRRPAVAGLFYPGDVQELQTEISALLQQNRSAKIPGFPLGLILPHAGYQYSGATAASGYRQLQGLHFEVIVIVSPSHREYFDGITVYDRAGYTTPMGKIPVNESLRSALLKNETLISASSAGHGQEHAVEVQLPFLQHMYHDAFSMLPIVMGDQRKEYCIHLGKKLGEICEDKNVLLIASSDLSHYHPYTEANELDQIVIDNIKNFNCENLLHDLETERTEACGGGPVAAVMIASELLGADKVTILHHCNSGDITGDHSRVVGYLSAIITRPN